MVVSEHSQTGPPEVRETHAAVIVLVGDRAFKVKKPVSFEFLDFSTPEKRHRALVRELELNKRLAPDVYEGIYSICDDSGRAVEYALVMKRMPDDRSLEHLARMGASVGGCLGAVAQKVANFHRSRPDSTTSAAIAAEGEPQALDTKWQENFSDIRRFVPGIVGEEDVAAAEKSAIGYLAGRSRLLRRRIEEGEIKDGHGDLLAADIFCLDSEPAILDCIEFEDRYRYVDVASEVAFLAMDLVRLGRPEAARRFLVEYVQSYEKPIPYTLLEHYIAYRASVRAKVSCLSYEQGRRDQAEAARRLTALAAGHAARALPLLVVVGGSPGTGKSSLARALHEADPFAEAISGEPRFELLRSDVVRKELAGMKPDERSGASLGEGIYSSEFTRKTYDAMLEGAGNQLAMGRSVVLDATFAVSELRKAAAETAEKFEAVLVELCCEAPQDLCEARIRERAASEKDPSEADQEVAAAIRARFEEWPTAASIDTSGSTESALRPAIQAVERITGTTFCWA